MINTIDGRPQGERPLVNNAMTYLFEDWSSGAIDASVWGQSTALGGTLVAGVSPGTRGSTVLLIITGIAVGSNAQLYSLDRWQNGYASFNNTSSLQNFTLEFEAMVNSATNIGTIDEAAFFMGLSSTQLGNRASNNIIGFGLTNIAAPNADVQTITDNAGVETTNSVATIQRNVWHHYRITTWNGRVFFFFDHTLVATHTTNVPTAALYLDFIQQSDIGTFSYLYITNITAGYQRYPEQILV